MESRYTKEDLSLLADTLKCDPHHFKDNLNYCLTGNSIPEMMYYMIKEMYPDCYQYMYRVSYEELPLYINHDNDTIVTIIKWRLTLGK